MIFQIHSKTRYNRISQQGFTLVEIMLAITLSMILIAGVVQVYLSSKTSFQVQNQLARLQENQRISIDFLQRDIRQAGFNISLGDAPITVTEGVGNGSDSIVVRYSSATDCLGADTPEDNIAVNRYFIQSDAQGDRLMCLGNGSAIPQPIADGVSNMQILFGEKTIDNETSYARQTPSANRYVKVGSVANLNRVVSIRIALLVESEQPIRTQNLVQSFTVLDAIVAFDDIAAPADRIKRQVITTTIPLRNNSI